MSLRPLPGRTRPQFWLVPWIVLILAGMPRLLVAAAPANDSCAGAFGIPSSGPFPYFCPVIDVTSATLAGETTLTNALCSAPVSRGIWFKFRPSAGGFYTLTTCAPGSTVDDTVMAVYSSVSGGCGGPFVELDCNDDAFGTCNLLSVSTVPLLADTDYYVVVWLYDTAAPVAGKSSVQLVVTREIPPPNDTCPNALPLFLNTPVTGSTVLGSNN